MGSKQSKLQKTTPKGINPKTGKPYDPVKREDWNKMLKKAASDGSG